MRAGLTAERVTVAAADFADEAGLPAVTVSGLARRLGVRDASLYSHVPSLVELRVRIAVLAAREMTDGIGTAVAGRAGHDALVAFAGAYRDFAIGHPGRYEATQLPLAPDRAAASPGHVRAIELSYGVLRLRPPARPRRVVGPHRRRPSRHIGALVMKSQTLSVPGASLYYEVQGA